MESKLFEILVRMALASSGAMVLVLMLRGPLRRFAGAHIAYLSWLVVPFALLAAAMPTLRVTPELIMTMAPVAKASLLIAGATAEVTPWFDWVLRAWACGALASAMLMLWSQHAFVRSLGVLSERDGLYYAEHTRHGPALLGLWRPIVVVPADFAQRYTGAEQALIIAHERLHAERRDPAANAVLALLQCAFWFNPLMHVAASRFRFDQELACDEGVMARHGGQRQAYAAAMLKSQAAGAPALATCHWQSSHPLKERILQLKQTPTNSTRRRAGRMLVALLAGASVFATVAVRAETAASAETYDIIVKFDEGANNTAQAVRVQANEDIKLNWNQPGVANWNGVFNVAPATKDSVYVKLKVTQANGDVDSPVLQLKLGQEGAVGFGAKTGRPAYKIGVTVTRAAAGAPIGAN